VIDLTGDHAVMTDQKEAADLNGAQGIGMKHQDFMMNQLHLTQE
jgi:hypothetical protein